MPPLVYKISAWTLLVAGSLLSALQALQVREEIERQAQSVLDSASDQIAGRLSDRILNIGLVLRAGAAVLASADEPDRDAWRDYVQQLDPDLNLPGVSGIGFAAHVAFEDLAAHEAQMRAAGFADYAVYPSGLRDSYAPVVFLEPADTANEQLLGFDMASEPARRMALGMAAERGDVVLSGPVSLALNGGDESGDEQTATVLQYPVYRKGVPLDSSMEREAALLGWTYSPWLMTTLVNGILGDFQQRWSDQLSLQIYDGPEPLPAALLYRSADEPGDNAGMAMIRHVRLNHFHRQWLLVFNNSRAMARLDYGPVWTRLGAGLTISVLLFGVLLNLKDSRKKTQLVAQELTARIRSREKQLGESEARWKFVLDHSEDGIWEWDIANETVAVSRKWKAMLGYGEYDMGASIREWERRVHPEDLAEMKATMQGILEGKVGSFEKDHRMQCKDGSWRQVHNSGLVVSRDRNGAPLRLLGTQKDLGPA